MGSVETLMRQHEREPLHARHVAMLTLAIFDGMQGLHGFGGRDRELLAAAALLHDIGWSVERDGSGHHKASARLIREHSWSGASGREVAIIACVARYHRKALPGLGHEAFAALAVGDRRRVEVFAACLRLGDAIDRSHVQRIRGVRVGLVPGRVVLELWGVADVGFEAGAVARKADLAERVFGVVVECVLGVGQIQ